MAIIILSLIFQKTRTGYWARMRQKIIQFNCAFFVLETGNAIFLFKEQFVISVQIINLRSMYMHL